MTPIKTHQRRHEGSRKRSLLHDTTGLSTVEYIIVLVLIGVLAIALWQIFGATVGNRIDASATGLRTMEGGSSNSSGASASGGSGTTGGGSGTTGGGGRLGGSSPSVTGEVAGTDPSVTAGAGGDPSVMGEVIHGGSATEGGVSGEEGEESNHVTTSVYVAPGTDVDGSFSILELIAGVGIILAFAFPILIAVQKMRGSDAGS